MGKGSRNRKQRSPEPSSSTGPYFHGGVPDKEPRDVLLPATQLGFRYNYHALGAPYDPGWVYLTTDERVASAYASRYLDGHGRAIPGDVHEVQRWTGRRSIRITISSQTFFCDARRLESCAPWHTGLC